LRPERIRVATVKVETRREVVSRSAGTKFCRVNSNGNRGNAYLRPILLYTRKFVIVHLLLLPPWRDGPTSTKTTVNVLLFLLRWFQNLEEEEVS
jgi:hypothetical protein